MLANKNTLHQYRSIGPGRWQANPYATRKHIGIVDLVRRIAACVKVWVVWKGFDILIVDSAITGFFTAALSFLRKGRRKLVIASFNVPRRRKGFWRWLAQRLYRRVDHFFVHSRYDVHLAKELYKIPEQRITFRSFVRPAPATGKPPQIYLFEDKRPYILSFGGNARDYGTFFQAIEGSGLSAIVVAREYNLEGLRVPDNVRAFCNIPLEHCDRLVGTCMFAVFTFDGSEPSCGQISIVTSFMLGKPVICTDCIGVRDYVHNNENGLLVKIRDPEDLRDKMIKLASDKELYRKLSNGAIRWATENARPEATRKIIDNLVTELTSS